MFQILAQVCPDKEKKIIAPPKNGLIKKKIHGKCRTQIQFSPAHLTLKWKKLKHVQYVDDFDLLPYTDPTGGDLPDGTCSNPTLMFRRARETNTHMGTCTHTSTLALNGWQLSLTYSSDTIRRRFFLKWYLDIVKT